jgi:hypothetical protein
VAVGGSTDHKTQIGGKRQRVSHMSPPPCAISFKPRVFYEPTSSGFAICHSKYALNCLAIIARPVRFRK